MTEAAQEKRSYKNTLNLPKTPFAMKANLVQNEPASMKKWEQAKLYDRTRQARAGSPRYAFHDGPPYANGSIHLGHLLNKVLKDFVVRSRTMMGFDTPFVPGWDCHGLPIEHKVVVDLGEKVHAMDPLAVRRKCRDSAEKFIKLQRGQMQRLLTLADYDHPYQTMDPAYEAGTLEVFATLLEKGLVYRALKPVHWSIENRTALAEAELEYYDRKDTSVYVLFELTDLKHLQKTHGLADSPDRLSLMIWTTTPWTLPANLAVAVNPKYQYGIYPLTVAGRQSHAILATDLAAKVLALAGQPVSKPLATFPGSDLLAVKYRHPFIDRINPVVAADYVTLEDGTGLVHTAPGHGVEDYQTGLREKLDIYCPVKEDGTFDDSAPTWLRGQTIWKGNHLVTEHLRDSAHLIHAHEFTHSYPHDWRGKTPVIFRATEQWFIGVDRPAGSAPSLRQSALAVTERDVRFYPEWGRNRMRGMLESRPDWCISRQRAWGLPIPAFFDQTAQHVLMTPASVRAVAAKFRQHGSDAWFKVTARELLSDYNPDTDPHCPEPFKSQFKNPTFEIRNSKDIFDVWFESGSSWFSVMHQRGQTHPDGQVDLYLEGSDQHRGWFQLSLLPALGFMGKAPFRGVLTHGFMVDKDGKKISKSDEEQQKRIPTLDALFKEFGVDIVRWWVSSLNYDNDIKVDIEFFKLAGEEYRKVRNTVRFLLSNLYDLNPATDKHSFTAADAATIDAWALSELATLVKTVHHAYDQFNFRLVQESLFNFCNATLSSIYLAAAKDRLYCDAPAGARRRRTQTAMFEITDALVRLLAPILPHTAEEAWSALHGPAANPDSVHLAPFPQPHSVAVSDAWPALMEQRTAWLKLLEEARAAGIDNPLDLGLLLPRNPVTANFNPVDLADLCMISRVEFTAPDATPAVKDLRSEPRCERSWKRDGTVKPRSDGGQLSDRDAAALGI